MRYFLLHIPPWTSKFYLTEISLCAVYILVGEVHRSNIEDTHFPCVLKPTNVVCSIWSAELCLHMMPAHGVQSRSRHCALVKLLGRSRCCPSLWWEGGCWLFGRKSMLGWPRAINRRLSQPSAASLIYGAPPIAPGFIWPLSNTCSVRARSAALAAPLCILNNPDGNCPFLKC